MLVLTRNASEIVDLMLGEQTISVTVIAIKGSQVRLGFDAPPEVNIVRREINKGFRVLQETEGGNK